MRDSRLSALGFWLCALGFFGKSLVADPLHYLRKVFDLYFTRWPDRPITR